jgi:type IX secretion system PorP/SprF family membrane protein
MKKLTLILFVLIFGARASAQDFHLSMYDAAPIYLNPAMTGLFEGKWRVHGQFRTQWKSVNYKPYTVGLISFDKPVGKWGFGLQLMNSRAGAGNYNVLEGVASVGYTVPLTKNGFHNLAFGVQAGGKQKSIEYQLLSFNNQYVTTNGGGFETTIGTNENFGAQRRILPVVNAGALYFFSRQESRLNPFIGISTFNLLQPDESFFSASERLPIRTFIHAGTRVNITESFYLIPKALVMNQQDFYEETFALDAGYFIKSSELYLLGGLVYRNEDAMVISLGARMDNFIAKIGYDINTSSLSLASTGRGGFEISFTYMRTNPKAPASKICPRL